jgi:ketosteroid isomerase-like protein
MRGTGWLLLATLGAAACHDSQDDVTAPSAAVAADEAQESLTVNDLRAFRLALRAADSTQAAAAAARGASGLLSALAEDALFLLPRSPLAEGKEAARALLAAPPAPFTAHMKLRWNPAFTDVSLDGRVGYSFGNVSITGSQTPGVQPAQYIAFWRRRDDGRWVVQAWSLSFAGALAGPPPEFFHHFLPPRETPPLVNVAAAKRDLLRVDAEFADASVQKGQAPAFRKYADAHAVTLNGGDPDFILGRQAIFESRQRGDPSDVLDWTPKFAGVGPHGDLGYTVGFYVFSFSGGQAFGKYLTIWHKRPNQDWKFMQDGGSSTPPPTP